MQDLPIILLGADSMSESESQTDKTIESRRGFLKYLGVSSAGVALAGAAAASKEKIKKGGEEAKAEIEKLQRAYEDLDRRTQLILRVVLVFSGLDIFF